MIQKLEYMTGQIVATYGSDPFQMTRDVLEHIDLKAHLKPDMHIGIKPNLILNSPPENGATTHIMIAASLIDYLKTHGMDNILILEGSWVGDRTDRAYRDLGWYDLAKKYGVKIVDTKKDAYVDVTVNGNVIEIAKSVTDLDILINLPVLKGHCQTLITGALKNLKGLLSDAEKRKFHRRGLHRPIAELNVAIPQSLVIVDGICGDLDFEEGGNPVPMNRILCGGDPVLCDSYIAYSMGYEPEQIEHVKIASELGVGSMDLNVMELTELNVDRRPRGRFKAGRMVERLGKVVEEDQACSACYANLIQALARLDERVGLKSFKRNPIHIGQGYKGKTGNGLGSGICTAGFDGCVPGCPPTTREIIEFLESWLEDQG